MDCSHGEPRGASIARELLPAARGGALHLASAHALRLTEARAIALMFSREHVLMVPTGAQG